MTEKVETLHAGGFIVSEGNGRISREQVTILSGQNLKAGAVLGQITRAGASAAADAGNTGDGAMGAITVSAPAKVGDYRLTIIEAVANAGAFIVEDPDGINVGQGNVAAAFSGGGLAFTLADGATDFAAGDAFTLTVATGSNKYRELNLTGVDGSEDAAGLLFDDVDASAADTDGVAVVRDAEVNSAELVYPTGASAGQKTQALADLVTFNIHAR